MTTQPGRRSPSHPLIDDYLHQLGQAAKVLPRSERDELLDEIRSHISAGVGPDASEADIRNVLDELGPPAAIVAAAHPGRPPERRGAREAFALVLLVLGFPPVLGWGIGAGLLLWSPLWTARQKLLGLLVWPGGLLVFGAIPFLFASRSEACVSSVPVCEVGQTCESIAPILPNCTTSGTQWWPVALAVILVLAPLAMATYLWLAAGRRSAPAAYAVE